MLFAIFVSSASTVLVAQKLVVSDWHHEGIDHERFVPLRKELRELSQRLFPDKFSPDKSISANQQQTIRHWRVSKAPLAKNMILTPTWCDFIDRHMWILTLSDLASGEVMQMRHGSVPNSRIWNKTKDFNPESIAFLQQEIGDFINQVENRTSLLQLGVHLRRQNTKRPTGICMTMLMTEALLKQTTARIRPLEERQDLIFARQALDIKDRLMRASRSIGLEWNTSAEQKTLSWHWSEAIFGNALPIKSDRVSLTMNDELELPPKLREEIQAEELSLRELPRVVKTYGAWAYVDQGRTYGLNIDDRLVNEDGSIKGHVVGFYGPELKLTSKSGHSIAEGAIIYIRKGQRSIKLGDSFEYEQVNYPTPWPP